jgi:hypothetical protein
MIYKTDYYRTYLNFTTDYYGGEPECWRWGRRLTGSSREGKENNNKEGVKRKIGRVVVAHCGTLNGPWQ